MELGYVAFELRLPLSNSTHLFQRMKTTCYGKVSADGSGRPETAAYKNTHFLRIPETLNPEP